MAPSITIAPSAPEVSAALAEYVAKISGEAIAERGKFTVALSGGSLPSILAAKITEEPAKSAIDWRNWHVFFADERFVPLDHPDSNYLGCRVLFDRVPIPRDNIYTLDHAASVEDGAAAYEAQLRRVFRSETPSLDLVLLGVGEDGHTCSLFPGHALLKETGIWVAPIRDSPKPPPQRITLTFPVLNAARHTGFVCTGAGKAPVVKNILEDGNSGQYPAGMVRPEAGDTTITWFLDKPAAAQLA